LTKAWSIQIIKSSTHMITYPGRQTSSNNFWQPPS